MKNRCVVVGAGVAGLSSAALLANKGYDVVVLEQAPTYGGKVGELYAGDAYFDTGPSLCTDPGIIDEIFIRCGKKPRDYWQYEKHTEITRYFWPDDGTSYVMPVGIARIERSLVHAFNEHPKRVRKYMDRTLRTYERVAPYYLNTPLSVMTLLRPRALLASVRLLPMVFRSVNARNQAYFTNTKTVQLFDRFATYSGSNPYKAPAVMGFAGVLEMQDGAYVPKGGMRSIATALYNLCIDMGVEFRFGQKVTAITRKDNHLISLKTAAATYTCVKVIYGGDIVRLYEALGDAKAKHKVSLPERSTSAIVFYWEVRGAYKKFGLHNIIFSNDYKTEYDQLRRGEVPTDPTIYINITSKVIPKHATKGTENWFVMVNVPAGTKDIAILTVKEVVLKKLESMLGGYITILNESVLSPSTLDASTGAWQGAIYGQATNSIASLLLRPKNRIAVAKNAYSVGGTVHPGGGIPLAIRSAIIVAGKL